MWVLHVKALKIHGLSDHYYDLPKGINANVLI